MAGNVRIDPTSNLGEIKNPVTPSPTPGAPDVPSVPGNPQQLPQTPSTNVQQPTKVPDVGAAAEVVEDADAAPLPESTDAAAEESSNRYIIVQPPDDSGAGETNEDVPVFAILLLIVLAVAIAVAFIRMKKKRTAEVEADGYLPISQSTSKIEQGYRASAADIPHTERERIENYAKKYDIPIEEFYPDSLVHRRKPKKKSVSEASRKTSSPPKMKPPLSY